MQRYIKAWCSLQEGTPAAGWTKQHLTGVLAQVGLTAEDCWPTEAAPKSYGELQ